MKMELSKRLQAVADMVTPGMRLADIGTDHAYIPIYLMESGKIPHAIAMDINKGPLERAKEHIEEYGLQDQIQIRLSDGMAQLMEQEADCAVMAGMGGGLVIRILEDGCQIASQLEELVLQPQSELAKVRTYLLEHGYQILGEDMVCEDGKYYPMMKVKPGNASGEIWRQEELEYGKYLLTSAHPVLKQFLDREIQIYQNVLESMTEQNSERVRERQVELEDKIQNIQKLLQQYFEVSKTGEKRNAYDL